MANAAMAAGVMARLPVASWRRKGKKGRTLLRVCAVMTTVRLRVA